MRVFDPSDPVVLVDMDGVVADFVGGLQDYLEAYQGYCCECFERIPLEKCTKYIVQDLFEGEVGRMAHQYPKYPEFF